MHGGDSRAVCRRVEAAAAGQFMLKTKNKVLVYLTWRDGLLTFTQPRFPEAGRQVVAGTVDPGEMPVAAALRELREESGIDNAEVVRILGNYFYSMTKSGRSEIQHRHVVHVRVSDAIAMKACWTHFEATPSTGGEPIEFNFEWHPFFEAECALIGGPDSSYPC